MKTLTLVMLSLVMLSVAAPVSAEDFLAAAPPELQRYKFTGSFQKRKGLRNLDTLMLADDNVSRNVFVATVRSLQGKDQQMGISSSILACIGNPAEPYVGQVEIVASIMRMNGDWISLRLLDADCERLPN
jgi:hypothetical protein